MYGLYDTSGSQDLYSGLFRDASDSGKWKLFKDNQEAPTTTVNTSGTGYAVGTLVANLEGSVTAANSIDSDQYVDGSIDNVHLAGSIADSKLATISTAGKVDIGALEIDGATDIGAAIDGADLIIVDDGAGGTERKAAMSRVKTFVEASTVAVTGNVTATGTVEPAGDTAADDNAAIGYTAAEGLILTGQGSTNDLTIKNDADADVISIPTGTTGVTFAGTIGSGAITSTGVVTATGFTIGSAVLAEAELEMIDGITAGTAAASKALVLDGNKDIGTIRNLTIDGTLSDGNYTFDTSGNVSGLGTVGCGAVTSSGIVTGTGFTAGSAVLAEAELEFLDGITAGTVAASKCLVVDSNKDLTALNDVRMDSLGIATAASGTSGEIRATNDVTAFYSSDIALKENIVNIPSPMDLLSKINGVFFDWKQSYIDSKGGEDGYFVRKRDVGVIAQEVEKVMPEIVGTRKDGLKGIKYERLTSLLIECVKDLQGQIDILKGK
jgi:hypothetical protein